MTNKVEELINTLDPTKVQCKLCKKWFDIDFPEHVDDVYNCVCTSCFTEANKIKENEKH